MTYLKLLTILPLFILTVLPRLSQAVPVDECMEQRCIVYFNEWQNMASTKRVTAMSALGELYYQGYGTEKNLDKSLQYFRKASKYQFAYAQYRTGVFYLMEENFIDNEQGIKYLRKAANNGHVESAFLLGVIFSTGELGIKGVGESDKWLVKALKDKHFTAQKYAGYLYKSGQFNDSHYIKVNKVISELQFTVLEKNDTKGQVAKTKTEIHWPHDPSIEVITKSDPVPALGSAFDFELVNTQPTKLSTHLGIDTVKKLSKCEKIFSCYNLDKQDFWRYANTQLALPTK